MANQAVGLVRSPGQVGTYYRASLFTTRSSRPNSGGQVVLEENPAIVKVANSWIIMNPGGGPTSDKPDTTLAPPQPGDPVLSF